jgi:hypothetical protein
MKKVTITQRALILRIRRKLRKKNQHLISDHHGHYHRVDAKGVVEESVDLLKLAKELGCIWPWESVA